MAGRSGGRENEHQARGPHVLVEEVLELADGVEIRQMHAWRRGRMEERRFDDQPGSQQNDRKREQARDLHAARKTGKEASGCFHHVFLLQSDVQGVVSIVHICYNKNDWPFFIVPASGISVNKEAVAVTWYPERT